ncbi:PDZ domain-containing protein [Ammoniphilus sp. CFH 90114]|nr:PDZ domain-containing protein [Ammoniphilus sp. CFH 90114]
MKGSTLAALLGLTMVFSSLFTMVAMDSERSVLGQTLSTFLDKVGLTSPAPSAPNIGNRVAPSEAESLKKIYEVYGMIQQNYLEEVDPQKLVDGAINGMINSLEDPYSVYMDPKSAEQFTESIHSSFQGIGAEVTMEGGKVTIVSPFKGSPAEKAGLRPHDQVISVNGESLEGLDLYEAVLKIRGPKGSEAKLEVIRPGLRDALTVIVVRDEIPLETVYSETIKKNGKTFGKIEVTQFSMNTGTRFKEELEKFEKEKVDGLIIDLRGNPGGLLNVVVDMGHLLVPNKGVILQVEDTSGTREVMKSKLDGKKPYPITVLIDKGSASASEILAGALKENGYKIVGQTSFGKGTVQNSMELEDKSQVKMTIAKWLTPSGGWINKTGVEPTVAIEQPKYFFAAPISLEEGNLKYDQNGEAIHNLQMILEGLGFPAGRTDGYFDEKTVTAVKAFQKLNELPMTGEVDEKTAAMLQEQLVKKIKDPANDLQLQAAIQVLDKEAKK